MKYRTHIYALGAAILVSAAFFSTANPAHSQDVGEEETHPGEKKSGDGTVHLQNPVSLVDLINTVSEINGEPYVIDGSVTPGEVSIITPEGGLKEEDLLLLFDTILSLNGLALVKSDGINKIIKAGDARHESLPVETGTGD